MSMSTAQISREIVKPIAVGFSALIADNMITYEGKMDAYPLASSIMFGLSSGVAVIGGTYIAPYLTGVLPIADTSLYSGKTLEARIIEITVGGTGAFMVNSLLGSNMSVTYAKRIAIFGVADVFGEYLSDYICGEPLSFLQ